jgi:hypothetical protein
MFRSVFLGENPVPDLSLHVLWALVLCVMGGWQRFLGHVCLSYKCTGSSARRYGIRASQGQEPSNELSARTLLIPRIKRVRVNNTSFFTATDNKSPRHTYDVYFQHLYNNTNVFYDHSTFNSLVRLLHTGLPALATGLGHHRSSCQIG